MKNSLYCAPRPPFPSLWVYSWCGVDWSICLFILQIPPLPRYRFANLYFLFIVLLNWVPAINAFGKEISMLPVILGKRDINSPLKIWITSVADPWYFWYESGSADPCLWLMDPDSDPAIFIINLQDANKKVIKKIVFLLITFWRYIYIIFQR